MHGYDVVIIGGGLVGAGLACALRDTNLRVALVDAREPVNNDPRLFALNAGSIEFLNHIGLWSLIADKAASIQQVHVSSRGHFGAARLKPDDAGLPYLGYVVPAHYIEKALNDQMMTASPHQVYRPAILRELNKTAEGVNLVLSTENGPLHLQAGLVIGADGAESAVRKLSGIQADTFDYEQSAIVTRTMLTRSHNGIAYERFTDDGTIAMLPLCGNECATIWSGENAIIHELGQLNEDDFLSRLQDVFGYRLGRLKGIKQRHTFPLRMVTAKTMIAPHVLLLGNAAHALHPIAAQGFNLALYEVAQLVEQLNNIVLANKSILQLDLAAIYNDIKRQQGVSIAVSHQLAAKFSTRFSMQSHAARKLLPLGLMGLDMVSPVRRHFVKKIMGRSGRVPRLLLSANT